MSTQYYISAFRQKSVLVCTTSLGVTFPLYIFCLFKMCWETVSERLEDVQRDSHDCLRLDVGVEN